MKFDGRRLLTLGVVLLSLVVISPAQLRGQETWRGSVGAQSKDLGRQALAFLPNEIWIHAGDSVTWTVQTDEIHTVTFLKSNQVRLPFSVGCPGFAGPSATFDGSTCVTTPPLVKGQTFTVRFPTAGNFKLVCLVHENMTGAVHVLDLSQPLPHNQDFYDDRAADQRRDLLTDRDADRDRDEHHHAGHVIAGHGEVSATPGGSQTLSVLRFTDDSIVIHAGQTVEWTNDDPITPHTITFGTEPANPIPPAGSFTVDPDGALHAIISTTADSAHSGFIVAAPADRIGLAQAPLGNTRFRITFPKAGVFPYICALHDVLGMTGKVVVLP